MITQTNTNGVNFLWNNLGAVVESGSNTNTVTALPVAMAFEHQTALTLSGRQPGGASYLGLTNNVSPANASGAVVILMDDLVTRADKLGYTKSGFFFVTTNSTTAVTVPLTNTATNTNGQAGDTVFATWNMIIMRNLSGTDGVNSASMTVGPATTNGANLLVTPTNGSGTFTLDGSSAICFLDVNGVAINASHAAITVTPTAGGTFGMVICGS